MFKHAKYGTKVYSIHGLDFYVNDKPAKTKLGKDHVWLQIRQEGKKEFEVFTNLSYRNSVDVNLIRK